MNLWAPADAKDGALAWGCVYRPLVLDRAYEDGRIFRNLAALPRFWPVWSVRSARRGEFLEDKSIDFARETIVMGSMPLDLEELKSVPLEKRTAMLGVEGRSDGGYKIATASSVPFLLTSSEKLTPELRVRVDGEEARMLRTNLMFAAVRVGAGRHEIVFERRIGRGWWPVAGSALVVLGILSVPRPRKIRFW